MRPISGQGVDGRPRGISAGLDMSLRVVARLAGEELAARTARQMDYDWRKAR